MKNLLSVFLLGCVSLAFAETGSYSTTMVEVSDVASVEAITERLVGPGLSVVPTGAFVGTTANGQIGFFSGLSFNTEADSVRGRTEIIRNLAAFTNGVVLSTGDISQGQTVSNTVAKKSWGASEVKYTGADAALTTHQDYDKDLAKLCGEDHSKLNDTVGVVLYIVPRNKTINIPFMMVSEEFFAPNSSLKKPTYTYPDLDRYANYSDKFAFFLERGTLSLSDTRDMGMTNNIALLPDRKGIVEISSVNQLTNQDYFVSNVITNGTTDPSIDGNRLIFPAGDIPLPMEYNGAIVGPTAYATDIIPGETYTIKIVLADRGDRNCNSVIFLAEKSITSGADLKVDVTGPAFINEPGNVVFTNTVSNIGPATADGVVVTNYLPAGASYFGCNTSGIGQVVNSGEGYLVWTLGDGFKSGSNAVMTVLCNLPGTGFYTNSAVVVTSTGDYDESNNADECVTQVGGEIQEITVRAITTNKLYGTELALPGIQFIASLDGTNGEQSVRGVDVKFFKDGVEAFPTNKSTSAGVYQICLTNINISGLYPSAIIHYENGELTNECRAITIKANDTNKVYGVSLDLSTVKDAFTVLDEGDGLAEGERVTEVSIASDLALETSTPAGTNYNAVTLVMPFEGSGEGGFDPNNYVITPSNGTLVVDKRSIEITPYDGGKTYGETYYLVGDENYFWISDGELVNGDKVTEVTLESDGSASTAPWKAWYDITATNAVGPGMENYEISYGTGILGVKKFKFTIRAADMNRFYGSSIEFTGTEFSVDKTLPNGEKVETVTITGVAATNIAATVGTYPDDIVPNHEVKGSGGFNTNNYVITFLNGTLTVTNAPLTIIANDTNKVYGAEFSFTGDEFTTDPAALYNGDAITDLTLTSEGTNRLAVCGEYEIVVTNALGIGLENYDITYSNGMLTVTNALLTIIANSTNKVYGAELAFEGNEFTIASPGLLNDDTVTNVTLTSAGTPATASCGEYPIEPADALGEGLANYAITYSNGTLTVTQALLTVTANSTNRVYGTPFEFSGTEFTIGHPGLLPGDTITNVTLTCAATNATTGCGEYAIVATNALGNGVKNYRITYVPGEFKVKKFKITITADDTNKVYGSTVKFTGTEFTTNPKAEDFPNGETVTNVTLTSVGTNISASVTETYDIIPSHVVFGANGFHTNNYDISFETGTLTVTQALLTVKVNDAQYHIRRDWPPSYSVTFLPKLVDGDTEELMAGPEGIGYTNAFWTVKPDSKDAEGVYTNEIWATLESFTGPRATNYWITVEPGNLEVLAAMPELKVTDMKWKLKGATGLFEGTLTIKNVGDGDADTNCNYWVELIPGPATNDTESSVPHAYYLHSRTGTIPGGPGYQDPDYVYEYQDLTEEVRGKLLEMHPASAAFGTNESVTVTGINVYHWKRYNPSKGYFNTNEFFVVGYLYNPSDNAPTDFIVSEEEKEAAKSLLKTETGVSDYLEMSRLNLLQYYHWNTNAGTWKGPSK